MVNLPLALIGGVAGVFLSGGVLNVADAHRLHHALRHRHAQRHHAGVAHPAPAARRRRDDFREAVERGARERVVPIS
jgi:Cu/Ag efflux pump CusA